MAWVNKERKFWVTAAKLDRHLPLRVIAILDLIDCRESSVDNSKFLDAGVIETFQRSDPKVNIRIDRVLHKNRDIRISQCICNFLYKERIRGGSGADPHKVNTMFKTLENVLLAGNLSRNLQSILLLCLLHPLKTWHTDTLEASRMCPRLPDSRTEHIDSQILEPLCCFHHLLFCLCTARACHYAWSRLCEHSPIIKWNEI